ncbi:uncharacterized protein LOC117790007 [Drosophila innubila]|uniref:uncharacterized protein LOC117790007 n=1 Tax=Drosophila innubila TaxID=198719 RepID=UPI00148CB028|nr:uncharacterized protein LOC117790007 [Drosophila innubila]
MANLLEDFFYDCHSDDDSDDDSDFDLENNNCDQIVRAAGGYNTDRQLLPNLDDPVEIRRTLERVANTTRLLLRSVGGKCDRYEPLEQQVSRSFFYPATLEISARLLTDKSCPYPPSGQCRLRGDPVTLKLPMELNPYSGQVNLNIFQPGPKPLASCCHCAGSGDRRNVPVAKPAPESDPSLDPGVVSATLGHGVAQRPGLGLGPGGMRRHTQRHDGVHKSGRKVRWPEFL